MEKQYQLPKEFASKWVEALRCGEYQQTTGVLKDYVNGICHCGNGVGYEANGYEIVKEASIMFNGKVASGFESGLPIPLELFEAVVDMNDTKRKSFDEIADWIEENVEFI